MQQSLTRSQIVTQSTIQQGVKQALYVKDLTTRLVKEEAARSSAILDKFRMPAAIRQIDQQFTSAISKPMSQPAVTIPQPSALDIKAIATQVVKGVGTAAAVAAGEYCVSCALTSWFSVTPACANVVAHGAGMAALAGITMYTGGTGPIVLKALGWSALADTSMYTLFGWNDISTCVTGGFFQSTQVKKSDL